MAWEIPKSDVPRSETIGMKRPFIAVCIPNVGEWSVEFSDHVYSSLKCIGHPAFDKLIMLSRGSPLDVARNQFVQGTLKDSRFTHIMFVDTDIVFEDPTNPEKVMDPNEAIALLLSCDTPIVSGLYRARKKTGFDWSAWMKNPNQSNELEFVPIHNWSGNFFKVDVCGAGCLLVKREVFEKVPPPWFVWDDMTAKPSEDFYFNLKGKEFGYDTWIFSSVRCSHISGNLKVLSDGRVTTCSV